MQSSSSLILELCFGNEGLGAGVKCTAADLPSTAATVLEGEQAPSVHLAGWSVQSRDGEMGRPAQRKCFRCPAWGLGLGKQGSYQGVRQLWPGGAAQAPLLCSASSYSPGWPGQMQRDLQRSCSFLIPTLLCSPSTLPSPRLPQSRPLARGHEIIISWTSSLPESPPAPQPALLVS